MRNTHPGREVEIHTHLEILSDWGEFINTYAQTTPPRIGSSWFTASGARISRVQTEPDYNIASERETFPALVLAVQNAVMDISSLTRYADDTVVGNTNNTNNNITDEDASSNASSELPDYSSLIEYLPSDYPDPNPAYADINIDDLPPSTNPSPVHFDSCVPYSPIGTLPDELLAHPFTGQRIVTPLILNRSRDSVVAHASNSIPDLINMDSF